MRKVNSLFKKSLKVPARASVYYLSAGGVAKILGFLSTLIFTRMLSPLEYGKFALYMSVVGICEILLSSFISQSVIYRGLDELSLEKEHLIFTAKISCVIFSFVICLLIFTFSSYFGIGWALFPLVLIQVTLDGLTKIRLLEVRYTYSYKYVSLCIISDALLPSVIAYFLIGYLGIGYIGRALGFILSSALLSVRLFGKARKPFKFSGRAFSYIFSSALLLLPSAISLAILSETDKLILTRRIGVGAVGKYSVVHSVGVASAFLLTALFSALTPWVQRKIKRGEYSEITRVSSYGLTAFSVISVVTALFSPLVLDFLAPSEYSDAKSALLPLALTIIPSFSESLLLAGLIALGKTKAIFKVSILSSALSLISTIFLVRAFGYFGAGLSSLIVSSFKALEYSRRMRHECGIHLIKEGRIFRAIITSALFSVLILTLFSYPYLIPLALIPLACRALDAIIGARRMLFE